MIEFACAGETYAGYLSKPESGSGPGVIVVQEWWGLVGHIKSVADRFAEAGFTALAPDLYKGETTQEPDEAGSLMMAINIAETETIFRCAIERLLSDPTCSSSKIGIVGFCMGGQLALYAAATNPDTVAACVDFYGVHPNVLPPYHQLEAPVLGIFAEHDAYASAEAVAALDAELTRNAKPHEFHTYPGTHHAFFNDDRPAYDEFAAQDSWDRTIRFLREHVS